MKTSKSSQLSTNNIMTHATLLFLLAVGLSGSLALHIVMSPEEAEQIMKRDDGFSKGLAGFVDKKMSPQSNDVVKKEEKMDGIKTLLTRALQSLKKAKKYHKDPAVSVEIKKNVAPPGLPLDSQSKRSDDMASLETLVDRLIKEVNVKRKRSCHSFNCMTNYGREADNAGEAKKTTSADLDEIYRSVKRLVKTSNSDDVISDAGDVGDRMLSKVNEMIKKKSEGKSQTIFEFPHAQSDAPTKAQLERKAEKLLHQISQISKKDSASKVSTEVKDQQKDSVTDIKKELTNLLRKFNSNSDRDAVSKQANEVTSDDVAVEAKAAPAVVSKKEAKVDKRRAMIVDLLKTYDEMKKRKVTKKSDVYANELENASKTLKRGLSEKTAALLKGFETDLPQKTSHPK